MAPSVWSGIPDRAGNNRVFSQFTDFFDTERVMKSTSSVVTLVAFVVISAMQLGSPALAGTINLNNVYNGGNPFDGTDVDFFSVIETNGKAVATNYFQAPAVAGNTLTLLPENLRVEVNPGPGDLSIKSRLAMEIQADAGKTISQVAFQQMIEYAVFGGRPNDAIASADLEFSWEVLAGSSVGTTGNAVQNYSESASPSAGGSWSADYVLDLGTLAPGTTRVRFEFEDNFRGQATRSGIAYVNSSSQPGIGVSVTVVPEPTGSLLAVAGAVLIALARRRRK